MNEVTPSLFQQISKVSKHSLIYGMGTASTAVVGMFLVPLYTRYLTPADYGVLGLLATTTAVVATLVPLGVTGGLTMSYYQKKDDEEDRRKALGTAFIFLTINSLILLAILQACSGVLSSLFFQTAEYTNHFRLVFLTAFLNAGVVLTMLTLRVQQKPVRYISITITQFLISMGLNVWFLVGLKWGVYGILTSTAITAGLIYLYTVPKLIKDSALKFSWDKLKEMVHYGAPFIPSNVFGKVMRLSDRYFLIFMSTATQLGLYSMGYRMGSMVGVLLLSPFLAAWGPFFWSVHKQPNAKEIYSRIFTYYMLVIMGATLVLSVLAKEVLVILATPPFYDAYRVVPLVALSWVLLGGFNLLSVGAGLEKKTKWVPLITGVGAVVNLGLNAVFVPLWGMMGAAAATVIAFVTLPVGGLWASRRYHKIEYEWWRVFKIVALAGGVYAISLAVSTESVVADILLKMLVLVVFPIGLWITGFFKAEEIDKAKAIFVAVRNKGVPY